MNHYYFSYDHFVETAKRLLDGIVASGKQYEAVICPLRGGFFLSYYMSKHLRIPMKYIEISSYNGTKQGDFMIGMIPDLSHGSYLLCDDIYDSGNTIMKLRQMFPTIDMDIIVLLTKKDIDWITWGERIAEETWVDFFWEVM